MADGMLRNLVRRFARLWQRTSAGVDLTKDKPLRGLAIDPVAMLDYGKDLWSLGNLIAGFCVVQTILFLEEAGKHCSPLGIAVSDRDSFGFAFAGIVLFLGAEGIAIWLCHRGHLVLLSEFAVPDKLLQTLWRAVWVRITLVAFSFLSLAAFVLTTTEIEHRGDAAHLAACGLTSESISK